jgi:hypothetical protein
MGERVKKVGKRYLLASSEGEGDLLRAITRPDADGNQKHFSEILAHGGYEH